MAERFMVCLVGEQPAPNLLPILHYQPAALLLVCSSRTRRIADNLQQTVAMPAEVCEVDAYAIEKAQQAIIGVIHDQGWPAGQIIYNLTGGTKPMSFAAYRAAQETPGCMLIYLQTERGRSECYEYVLAGGSFVLAAGTPREITQVLNLDLYLRAQGLQTWQEFPLANPTSPGAQFEIQVVAALRGHVEELKANVKDRAGGAVEMDVLLRCQNQIGLLEVKQGKAAGEMTGLKQLNTFGAREYLGTYVRRLLVVDRAPNADIREQAAAHNVGIIVLRSFAEHKQLDATDADSLRQAVLAALQGR